MSLIMIMQNCIECGDRLKFGSKSGLCRPCNCRAIAKARVKPKPTCFDCGSKVSRRDVKRCQKCNAKYMLINPPNPKGTEPGSNHPSWNGGKTKDKRGYIYIKSTEHPNANARGYVFEHRLIMERHIGRLLNKQEVVHHINGRHDDNRIENLELFASQAEHINYHNNSG